jgi:hypothetical protein
MLLVATVPLRPREHPAHLVGVPGPPTARSGDAAPYEGVRDLSGRASAGGPDGLENWQQLKGSPISSMRYSRVISAHLSADTCRPPRCVIRGLYLISPCTVVLATLAPWMGPRVPKSAPGGSGRC